MGRMSRIYQNFITGGLSENRENQDYETTSLVFDSDTRIIFYKFAEVHPVYSKNFNDQKPMDTKVGYLCPYISENGKYCRFEDNHMVEIG